ncbi:CPBP family intramembrane glutamic endopeptidase [Dissulfurirhabdus thermomarina]
MFGLVVTTIKIVQQCIVLEPIYQRLVDSLSLSLASFFLIKRYPLEEKICLFDKYRIKILIKYGLPFGLSVAVLNFPYSYVYNGGTISPKAFIDPQQHYVFILFFLFFAVFVSPIMEELFIRGCLFRILRTKFSFFVSTLASTCLFVFLHNISSQYQFIRLFIISLMLTFCYEFSKTLTASMIAHSIGNGIWYVMIYGHMYGII